MDLSESSHNDESSTTAEKLRNSTFQCVIPQELCIFPDFMRNSNILCMELCISFLRKHGITQTVFSCVIPAITHGITQS